VIVRTWSARATPDGAAAYHAYFEGTLLPELLGLTGFAGGYLLAREADDVVELTTHTLWESAAAIRAFAGDTMDHSVVEPEARAVLLDFDTTVIHRDVLVDAGRPRQ
jgi:heme-degrading monooxygenase HmoA